MGRNILIFSDGTGQAGGLLVDENRSNIYKLYRATRVGPDSTIDPAQQLAFYDPGLGSQSNNGQIKLGIARKLYNLVIQGTGLGITKNMIDCYAAILTLWRRDDRIFLIGFSRGAYTVRCVAGVLSMCGVPTQMKDGTKLRYDPDTIRAIAKEAVKEVYQYGASIKGDPFKELRTERARNFRKEYRSGDDTQTNVASPVRRALGVAATVIGAGIAAFLAWLLSHWALSFWPWFAIWFGIPLLAFLAAYLKTHLRCHPVLKRFLLSDWSGNFIRHRRETLRYCFPKIQ
jgi:multisubunit Na+/H+ antiporter MnhC subunit